MSSIDDDGISTSLNQSLGTIYGIHGNAYTGCYTQTTLRVLASHWLVLSLGDVLVSNQTYQVILVVNYREFLNLVLLQDGSGSNQVGLNVSGNQILAGHHLINLLVHVALEAEVTVGNNTYEMVLIIHHWNTTDMIIVHHIKGILHCTTATDSNRVINHTILSTLHDGNLTSLLLDAHVLVDNTNTTFAGDGNRH